MPTYEYECTHCGHTFEAFQKITEKPLSQCPKCKQGVKRLISNGAGFILKGSGFYATDYRKKSPPDKEKPTLPACPKAKEGCNGCQAQ
jgi:putative FmdB family regulatory protein